MCHLSLSPTYQPAAHFGSWWRSNKDASGFRLTELKLRVKLEAIPVSMWGEEAQQWESAWSCGQMGRTHFLVDSENKECFVISSDMAADDKLAHPPIPHYASAFGSSEGVMNGNQIKGLLCLKLRQTCEEEMWAVQKIFVGVSTLIHL